MLSGVVGSCALRSLLASVGLTTASARARQMTKRGVWDSRLEWVRFRLLQRQLPVLIALAMPARRRVPGVSPATPRLAVPVTSRWAAVAAATASFRIVPLSAVLVQEVVALRKPMQRSLRVWMRERMLTR